MKFRIVDIKIVDRKRRAGDITALATSIKEIGLINPITIRPDGTLIAGLNRLEACKSLGWEEIEVSVSELDDLHAELAEIDENLVRNELHFLDRDDWMKRRKEIYEALYPETKKGASQALSMNKVLGHNVSEIISPTFAEDTSARTGQSKRNVELSIQRAKAFTPEQREVLKQADVNQTEATKLARYEPAQREAIVEKLATGEASTVKEAKALHEHQLLEAQAKILHIPQEIQLLQGDFNDKIKHIADNSISLIITDPPYNVASNRVFTFDDRSDISQDFGEWDKYDRQEFLDKFLAWSREWYRILKPQGSGYVFAADRLLSHLRDMLEEAGFHVKATIHWHKTNPGTQIVKTNFKSSVEDILFFTKGQGGHTFNWQGENEMHNHIETAICQGNERLVNAKGYTLHPTQKPEAVIRHLMAISSNPGDMVFDGFMGTATTAKVARDMGRRFIGIEQDEAYYEAGKRRLADLAS